MQYIDSEKVIWNEVEGNVILLQFSSDAFFVLNDSGSKIWKLMDNGNTIDEIVSELQKLYDISGEILKQDVGQFISEANAKDLLSDAPPAAPPVKRNVAGNGNGAGKPYEKPMFAVYSSDLMDSFAY